MYRLQGNMKQIKAKIKIWNQEVFGNIFKEKKKLEEQLEHIHEEWIQGNINQKTVNKEKVLMQDWKLHCQ